MDLIITEKDNVARRISDILSDGSAEVERHSDVNIYRWGSTKCIGLSGHVVGVDFPSEYENWRDVQPRELVTAQVITTPTRENIVNTLQGLARNANRVIIATDYDREGELIGKEAHDLVREANADVPIERVRFSSITEAEVINAFENPDDLDFDLAAAGEARQIVDLIWGAALTRFLSLATGQMGRDFISVGRVQTPTLKILVDKEREIQAFDPRTYWELLTRLRANEDFEAQYFYEDEEGTESERVWDEDRAGDVFTDLKSAETATIAELHRRTRTDDPPAPFNTTSFIRAAGSIGYSASQAMSIAEDLYTAGHITYPRTDNTVYPEDEDLGEILVALDQGPFEDDVKRVEREELNPTRGEEETTDHPPIHPTRDVPPRRDLSDDEWSIYELVSRRFLATLADPAKWEHLRITAKADVGDHLLKANGKRLLQEGYHAVYPYQSTDETILPRVEKGDTLDLVDATLEEKETQPPRRYGESRLIEKMEEIGLGTKSTRHGVIEKLYDRGYIEGSPPRPTTLAMAVVSAAEEYADLVVSEEMTRELEQDMSAIADGEKSLDEVTTESREMLETVFEDLTRNREEIGEFLRDALKADKTLGPCPRCGSDLLIRRSSGGSHFVGCDGYPDCEFTLPLPNQGEPIILEDSCSEHNLQHVKLLNGRNTFVHGCPLCQAERAGESEDQVIGQCPECGDEKGGQLAIKLLQTGNRLI
ncbi:MAG: DNA topoisomerase I, partial [Halobacteriaceae archaeon]